MSPSYQKLFEWRDRIAKLFESTVSTSGKWMGKPCQGYMIQCVGQNWTIVASYWYWRAFRSSKAWKYMCRFLVSSLWLQDVKIFRLKHTLYNPTYKYVFTAEGNKVFHHHPEVFKPLVSGIKNVINESGLDVKLVQEVGFAQVPPWKVPEKKPQSNIAMS